MTRRLLYLGIAEVLAEPVFGGSRPRPQRLQRREPGSHGSYADRPHPTTYAVSLGFPFGIAEWGAFSRYSCYYCDRYLYNQGYTAVYAHESRLLGPVVPIAQNISCTTLSRALDLFAQVAAPIRPRRQL